MKTDKATPGIWRRVLSVKTKNILVFIIETQPSTAKAGFSGGADGGWVRRAPRMAGIGLRLPLPRCRTEPMGRRRRRCNTVSTERSVQMMLGVVAILLLPALRSPMRGTTAPGVTSRAAAYSDITALRNDSCCLSVQQLVMCSRQTYDELSVIYCIAGKVPAHHDRDDRDDTHQRQEWTKIRGRQAHSDRRAWLFP